MDSGARAFLPLAISIILMTAPTARAQELRIPWMRESMASMEKELAAKYGDQQRARAQRGLRQVAALWREDDGDATVFAEFVRTHFAGEQGVIDTMFDRLERLFEQMNGHMNEVGRHFKTQADLDAGAILPFDEILAGYDPAAHLVDDFFKNKLAFAILLNFRLTTLDERLAEGESWTRRQWAEARLSRMFGKRMPADVHLAIGSAVAGAEQYIAGYNIWMHHLVDNAGTRAFPPKLRLLSHWNLRDEIKSAYEEGASGLAKQRIIQTVMDRIVTQTIPAAVVDNPSVDWNPVTNAVSASTVHDGDGAAAPQGKIDNRPEPDTRYRVLLDMFHAMRKADPYSPAAPTLIARRFEEDREIPEQRVERMLKQVLLSPLVPKVAALIARRLGRPLEPFDIWYNGFRSQGTFSTAQLDDIVRARYPNAAAFKNDIPRLLEKLGFSADMAGYLAARIEVDPARGSGHAMGASMRSEHVRLRTRIDQGGMNYKGFNIAVHEMGHNAEQVISLNLIDHTFLAGVPNTAFTEALAFVFQARDLDLLGLSTADPKQDALKALNDFWGAYEIAGVALVDMAVWHWMYDHPDATPAGLKEATLRIAKEIWNTYYAPVLKKNDVLLLGIYSHIIHSYLYLPDYPIGHLIAHQIEEQIRKTGKIGPEFERMARTGSIAPDLWMKKASGEPVGPDALLIAAQRALSAIEPQKPGR